MTDEENEYARLRAEAAARAISIDDDDLARRPLDSIIKELISHFGPEPFVLDINDRFYEHQRGRVTLTYPYQGGDSSLLMETSKVANQSSMLGLDGFSYAEVVFDLPSTPGSNFVDQLGDFLQKTNEQILKDVQQANELIERRQAVFADALREELQSRWTMTRALRGAMEQLQVPLSEVRTDRVKIPVQPAPLSMRVLEQAAAAGAPEWTLAEEMAESVVETIASFSRALERLPRTAETLLKQDEQTLRDVLLFILNANFRGQVTGETFIKDGKSDLLLIWEDRDAFVGECKIWKGSKALSEGLDQLLGRYTLWRHTRISLVLFIKDPKDATDIIAKAHEVVRNHPLTQKTVKASEPSHRGDYTVLASGDEKRPAHLTLLPVVIG